MAAKINYIVVDSDCFGKKSLEIKNKQYFDFTIDVSLYLLKLKKIIVYPSKAA